MTTNSSLKTFIVCLVLGTGCLSAPALRAEDSFKTFDASHWYLRGDLGVGVLDGLGSDEAFALGAGLGYRFNDMLRSDITLDYAGEYDLNIAGSDAGSFTSLINLYVDFKLDGKLTPYLGVGAGFADVDSSDSRFDDTAFAWALHTGVSYEVDDGVHLDFGYKYRAIENSGPNLDDHLFRFGIRFDLQ